MRVLVFSDVHGCCDCLKFLKETDDFKNASKVIFLGDVVMGGSNPNECIELLEKMNCECIYGNNDKYVFDHISSIELEKFDDCKIEQLKYMTNLVNDKNKKIMRMWKKELYLIMNNKMFYFVHYPWNSFNDESIVNDIPLKLSLEVREKMFKNVNADYIIFGHEHVTSKFNDDNKMFYCVGTIGLKNPGSYLVISDDNNKIEIVEKKIFFYEKGSN